MIPARLQPLLAQYDFATGRLLDRMTGPESDSGSGTRVAVTRMTDAEYFWEPAPGCWSVRRRSSGPGAGATHLAGSGEWGRDTAVPAHPEPAPLTTIAWRLSHLAEMLSLRADHTVGSRNLTRDGYRSAGTAAEAISSFQAGVTAWRLALASADEAGLDQVGRSAYPYGSDPEEPFIDVAWWVTQEVLHHGAEIALLRDLFLRLGQ